MVHLYVCIGAVFLAPLAAGFVEKDLVNSLYPGWPEKDLPCRIFSGYMDATPEDEPAGSIHMHYMFFESERSPATDPVLLWSNGGPGAGSEFGMFTELGPLMLSEESLKTDLYKATGVPTLWRNENAWTKVANVLIYDSPAPVGFSYCNNNTGGDGYSCGNWDDSRTARAAHVFMKNWMKAFPAFASLDLYLSGESYAGVYIPMLAREILNDKTDPTYKQLRGFAVGDGCVGSDVLCGQKSGPWFNIQFFHGHGQVSDKLYTEIITVCGIQQLQRGVTDKSCQNLVDKMDQALGGYYGYSLYDECKHVKLGAVEPAQSMMRLDQSNRQQWLGGALNDYPCGGIGAMEVFFNHSLVKKALNIPDEAYFFLSDNGVGFNYSITERNLMPFYQHVAQDTQLRVLVYNGDTDPGINSFVSQNWTVALGLEEVEAWRPWTLDGKQTMGGYVTRYAGGLDFLTIRGSGHMVPEYKPAAAFSFISNWLEDKDYPKYTAPTRR